MRDQAETGGTFFINCQLWCPRGLWARLWAVLVQSGDPLDGVDGPWQAAATAMGNARTGGALVGRHPPDRGDKPVAWRYP
jgi:hypothetical protein